MSLAQAIPATTPPTQIEPPLVHIPTPGDHYSPATGSAVITIIYELARLHAERNGRTKVLVTRGSSDGYPPYSVGELVEIDGAGALPGRLGKMFDAAWGRLFASRPMAASQFRAAGEYLRAASPEASEIFVHNAPAAMPLLRRALPNSSLHLYAHNQLFNSFNRREVGQVIDSCTSVICVSQFIANDIAARFGRGSPKLKVVINGVDTDAFCPSKAADQAGPPLVLFLGRVVPDKGVDLLVRAACSLLDKNIPFRLRIVGSSNFNPADPLSAYEKELRRLAVPLGDRCQFVPFVPRDSVIAEYQKATLFIVPSVFEEPCSLTIREAMSCGLPTVASRRGGTPEFGADAIGYFTPPDIKELAGELERLLRDPQARMELGARGRRRAEQFSWRRQYARLRQAIDLHD
jgi:glycosyltransferase involved in cell wall biosynthesis